MSSLTQILSPDPLHENYAFVWVYSQATYYSDRAVIYVPNTAIKKRLPGLEGRNVSSLSSGPKESSETNIERSTRRTRKAIKDYSLVNDFDLFATFTFRDDREDINRCKSKMANWIHNQQRRKGKFIYLIVPEFHKDKKAIHFHALLKNYPGEIVLSINKKTGRPVGKGNTYEIPSYRLGFTNVQKINKKLGSASKVAYYLQKYITKDMPLFAGKKRYWVSKGLNKPIVIDNPEPWFVHIEKEGYAIENGTFFEYRLGEHPLSDMFIEAHRQ